MSEAAALHKKLRLLPGSRAYILNAPAGLIDSLAPLPAGVVVELQPVGTYDFVQLFVKNRAELEALSPAAFAAVKYDGILWVCYPKGSSGVETDINRDSLWKLIAPSGLRPVTQIAIDAVWSGLRFRPIEAVKGK